MKIEEILHKLRKSFNKMENLLLMIELIIDFEKLEKINSN